MSLYEVPFEYWEWEEPEKTVLQLEHLGMGELIKILKLPPKTVMFSVPFLSPDISNYTTH